TVSGATPSGGSHRSTRTRAYCNSRSGSSSDNRFREGWLIKENWNKRSWLKPPMNADARGCPAPLIGVNRRASAVAYPRRYEAPSIGYWREQSSQNGQILRHRGRRFGVQPSGCTDRGRLKPELQTSRAQRMAGRYEEHSLYT